MKISEGTILSDKTISINLNDFISGKSNKLIIAGLSGAGKSTLGRHLAKKYNAEFFETDQCIHMLDTDKNIGKTNFSLPVLKKIMKEAYLKCVKPKLTNNQRMVIEGGFIWQTYVFHPQYRQEIGKHPTIIVGASALKASVRALSRIKGKHTLPYTVSKVPKILSRNFKFLNKMLTDFRKLRTASGGNIEQYKIPVLRESYRKDTFMTNYLRFLTEGQTPNMFYHASPTQGLTQLDPKETKSTHLKTVKPYVYVTDDPTYAAGFSFEWSNNEGFRFGSNSEDVGDWYIEIPSKYKSRLNTPCSMYHIRNQGFRKVYGMWTPEWYSKSKVRIFREEKFRRAIDCMNKYNVQITFR